MCASRSLPVAIKSSSSDRKWVSVVVSSEATLPTTSGSHHSANIDLPGDVLPLVSTAHRRSPTSRPCCVYLHRLLQATTTFLSLLHVTNLLAYTFVPTGFFFAPTHTPAHRIAFWFATIHDIYFIACVSLLCKHYNRSLAEWLFNCLLVLPFWLAYDCLLPNSPLRLFRLNIDVGLALCRCWSLPLRLYWTVRPLCGLVPSVHTANHTALQQVMLLIVKLVLVIALIAHGAAIVIRCTWLLNMEHAPSYHFSVHTGISLLVGEGGHIASTSTSIGINLLLTIGAFLGLLWRAFVFFFVYNRRKRTVALRHFTAGLVEHVRPSSSSKHLVRMLGRNERNRLASDESAIEPQPHLMHICNWSLLQDVLYDVRLPALRACAFIQALKHHAAIDSYVRHLCALTLFETFNGGELLVERGHTLDRMAVIVDGCVDVLAADDDATPVLTLPAGACVAQMALLLRVRARATLRCRSHVRLLTLARGDFLVGTLDAFGALYRHMRRNCNQLVADSRMRHRTMMAGHAPIANAAPHRVAFAVVVEDDLLHRQLQQLWNGFVTTAAVLVAVAYPYLVAVRRAFPPWFHAWCATPIEIVFVADWLLAMVQVAGAGRWRCARVTQHWSFYVDFCACVYLEHIVYEAAAGSSAQQRDFLYHVGKLNRVVKAYKLFYHLEQLPAACSTSTKRLLLAALYGALLAYLTAMAFVLSACFHVPCAAGSWRQRQAAALVRANATSTPIGEPLMGALQMALDALLRMDAADAGAVERMLGAGVAICGCLLVDWFAMEGAALAYMELRLQMARRSDAIDMRAMAAAFPARLQRRLAAFYEMQCEGAAGCCGYALSQLPAGGFLSRPLTTALLLQRRADDLHQVAFVGHVGRRFADLLALRSKLYLLPAHDTLTHMGNMNKEMFVLTRGFCAYKTKDSYYKRMGPSAHFGMVSLLFNLPEVFTVRTLTPCVLISIDGSALQEALRHYPHVNAIIRSVMRSGMYLELVEEGKQMAYAHLEPSVEEDVARSKAIVACKALNGENFLNVLSYCRQRNEDYRQPFKQAEVLPFLYLTLPLVIIPWGLFYRSWMVLRICVAFAYGILVPVAFILPANEPILFATNICCDIVVYIDFLIQAYVCYANSQGVLVVHPLQTMRNFQRNALIVDLLLAFPYGWIAYPNHFRTLRCICMLQVIRFFAYLSHVHSYRFHYIDVAIAMLKCLSWMTLIAHCFSCILVALECVPTEVYGANVLLCSPQSWIARSKYSSNYHLINGSMIQAPAFDVYLLGFYWSTCILSGIHWRDIFVQGGAVLKARLALVCISVCLHGYLLKLFMSLWLTSESSMKILRKLDFRFKLLQLRRFMESQHTSKELMAKINKNASFFWKRSYGIDRTLVLSHLHTTLLQDSLAILYEDTLRQVPLFQDMDKAFLRIVSLIARPLYFLPGQVIVSVEDVCDEFYIIHEGIVHVELARSSYHINLSRGSLLGYFCKETTPLMSIVARSTTYVDVLCIKSIDYFNILKNYTKFDNELKNVLSEYKDFIPNRNVEDSMVNVVISKKRNEVKFIRMVNIILQNERFHNYCDICLSLLAFFNLIVVAFNFITPHAITVYCNCVLDLTFALHFGLNFIKPFYNERCELITNYSLIRKEIGRKRKMYIVEIVLMVLVTFSYIFLIGNELRFTLVFGEPFAVFAKVRLLALYRCKYLGRRCFVGPDDPLLHLESILRIVIGIIIALHTFACVWCMITIYIRPQDLWTLDDKVSVYLESYLLAANILHSTATVTLVAKSRIEMVTLIASMIAMRVYMCFMIYKFICYLWMCLKTVLRFNLLLNELVKCLRTLRINKFQIRVLTTHLVKMETLEFGCNFPVILSLLPSPVVYELKIALYQNLLEKSYIFHGTQPNFQRNIAVHLQRAVYFDGEVIIHVGEVTKCMYFINHGSVEIISVNDNHTETRHDVLHTYEMFGLGQGLFRMVTPHQFTFKAQQRVEILSLHLEHWEHLLRFFPKSKDIIYNRIRTLQL